MTPPAVEHPRAAGPCPKDGPLSGAPASAGGPSGQKKEGGCIFQARGPEARATDLYAVGANSDGLTLAVYMLTSESIALRPRG